MLDFYGIAPDGLVSRFQRFSKRFNLAVRVVFRPFNAQSYFSLKSKVPEILRSGVIYKYTCLVDPNISYIGKTKRRLIRRIQEHGSLQDSAVLGH